MKFKKSMFVIAAVLQLGVFSCFAYADDVPVTTDEGRVYENGGISKIIMEDDAPLDRIERDRDTTAGEESSYNTDLNALQYVTPVKNQGRRGACWAMASTEGIESAYMKTNDVTDGNSVDFSEEHLIEGVYGKNSEMTYVMRGSSEGGNCKKADGYFTRKTNDEKKIYGGPVADSDLEYILPDRKTVPEYSDEMNFERVAYVNNFSEKDYIESSSGSWKGIKLDSAELTARNEKIKEWLVTNGAVPVDIYCGESSSNSSQGFYSKDGKTVFYQNDLNSTANHSVTIVGYDDSFDKDNFSDFETYNSGETEDDTHYAPVPKNNGAFIVANSWGSSWGKNNGYFYMSYETQLDSIYTFSDVTDINDKERGFDEIYEYVPFSHSNANRSYTIDDKACFYGGNIFEKSAYNYEEVSKIGIYVPKSQTRVKLYCDSAVKFDDVKSDNITTAYDGLTQVEAKSTSTEVEDIGSGKEFLVKSEGYYVFELKTPIKIEDTGFSVAACYERDITGGVFPAMQTVNSTSIKFTKNGYSMYGYETSSMTVDATYDYPIKAYTNQFTELSLNGADPLYVRINNSLNELYGDTAKNVKFYTVWDIDENDTETYMPFDKDEKISDAELSLLTDSELKSIYEISNVADVGVAAVQGDKESGSENIRFVSKINTSDFPGDTQITDLYYILYNSESANILKTTKTFYTNGVTDYAANEGEIMFVSETIPAQTAQNYYFVSTVMELETENGEILRINSTPIAVRTN